MKIFQFVKFAGIIFLSAMLLSGCILDLLIPAPDRLFTPQDILIEIDDLPEGWVVMFGPRKVVDNTRSNNSAEIAFAPYDNPQKRRVTLEVFRYSSERGAKSDFSVASSFPGETDIDGWSFVSSAADEQKISCFTYSNSEFPICTWIARYHEFVVEFYVWIGNDRLSIGEMEIIVITIDERIQNLLIDSD